MRVRKTGIIGEGYWRYGNRLEGRYKCEKCGGITGVFENVPHWDPALDGPFKPRLPKLYGCMQCGHITAYPEENFEKVSDTYQEHVPTVEELSKEARKREERAKAILDRKCILCGSSNPQRGVVTRRGLDLAIKCICQNCVETIAKEADGPDLIVLEEQ